MIISNDYMNEIYAEEFYLKFKKLILHENSLFNTNMVEEENGYTIIPNEKVADNVHITLDDKKRITTTVTVDGKIFNIYLSKVDDNTVKPLEFDESDGSVYGLDCYYGCVNFKFPEVGDILITDKGKVKVTSRRYNDYIPTYFPIGEIIK